MLRSQRVNAGVRRRFKGKAGWRTRSLIPVSASAAEINLAAKVVQLGRLVKSYKPEVKYIDASLGANAVSVPNGVVQFMTPISANVTSSDRIGNAVKLVSWNINIIASLFTSITATVTTEVGFRFYVVLDMQQASDTTPTGAMLVDQPSLPFTQLPLVSSMNRFKILWDSQPQLMYLNTGAASITSSAVNPFRMNFNVARKCSIPQRWNGTTAADIEKNGVYLFCFTNAVGAAGANIFDYLATSRVAFTDV